VKAIPVCEGAHSLKFSCRAYEKQYQGYPGEPDAVITTRRAIKRGQTRPSRDLLRLSGAKGAAYHQCAGFLATGSGRNKAGLRRAEEGC